MLYIQSQTQRSVGTVEEYRQYERRTISQPLVEFDKVPPDIGIILAKTLPNAKTEDLERLKMEINSVFNTIDWYLKDGIISGLRRAMTRILSDMFSAVDAKSKANEIIDELLR